MIKMHRTVFAVYAKPRGFRGLFTKPALVDSLETKAEAETEAGILELQMEAETERYFVKKVSGFVPKELV